jgi:hypothetical protein
MYKEHFKYVKESKESTGGKRWKMNKHEMRRKERKMNFLV